MALLRDRTPMDPLLKLSPAAAAALPDAIRRIVAAVDSGDLDAVAAVADFPLTVESPNDQCTTSAEPTFPDHPVTHKNAKEMRRDCLAYRKQQVPSRANPCPTGNDEPVGVSGGDDEVDVRLHLMCSFMLSPVYRLVWRAGAWKLQRNQRRIGSLVTIVESMA